LELKSHTPDGPIEKKWLGHRDHLALVNATNKRKYTVLMVGSGLAGASAAAHQRRQELHQRRRQRLPAFLRHHQGR
jgi:hypothetical protein